MSKFSIRVLAIVLALLVPVSGMGGRRTWGRAREIPPDDREQTLSVNGVTRSYIPHVPKPASKDDLRPLVLVFHGGGGHARNMPNFTGFGPLADAQGFVVAYPDSFNKSWSDTRGLSPADDVGFTRALISQLQHSAHVDVVGWQNIETLELVVHGPALRSFLRKDLDPDIKAKLEVLLTGGTRLDACQITMQRPHLFRGGVAAEQHDLRRVAREEMQDEEHQRRDAEEHRQAADQPPADEPAHAVAFLRLRDPYARRVAS